MHLKSVLSTLICLISQACNASYAVAIEYPQHIAITNDTEWSLSVIYSYDGSTPLGATVVPHGRLFLMHPLTMESLQVMPSGKYLSKTQIRTPENLKKRFAELKSEPDHFSLKICSPKRVLESLFPFTFAIDELSQKELVAQMIVPKSGCLIDAFANARAEIEKGKIPFPRHYLELSLQNPKLEESFSECLDEAYKRLHTQWQRVKHEFPEYVKKVQELLANAYGILKTQKELLEEDRIKKHLPKTASLKNGTYSLAKKTSIDSFQVVNTNIGVAPLSLKDIITDMLDTGLKKAYEELKNTWGKMLVDDEDLSIRVQSFLDSEYDFLKDWKLLEIPIKKKEKKEDDLSEIFKITTEKQTPKNFSEMNKEVLDFLLKQSSFDSQKNEN